MVIYRSTQFTTDAYRDATPNPIRTEESQSAHSFDVAKNNETITPAKNIIKSNTISCKLLNLMARNMEENLEKAKAAQNAEVTYEPTTGVSCKGPFTEVVATICA
ncbi:hypothetical protein HNY73_018951 [Argiope bruennichi]|uniref:Uncharacterized protein n=1 Tax=Argiope bruennichi TaxID=94029 RepID=A0A8T0EI15_ARGBR|nr:hypothetical protein HNY73_018951 [Argiope bruennichi]